MPIAITCPECGKGYKLPDTQRGKKVVCRDCDHTFVAKDKVREAPDEEDERPSRQRSEEPERPRRARRDADEERPRRRRDEDEDDRDPDRRRRDDRDEERPREKKRGMSPVLMWGLIGGGGGGVVLLIGIVMVVFLLLGNSSKLTVDNVNKLKVGMSRSQVEDIIGPGKESAMLSTKDIKNVVHESGKNKIVVIYQKDKMAMWTGVVGSDR